MILSLLISGSPVSAAETAVTTDTSWLDQVASPGAYFHVRDGDISSITPEEYMNRYRTLLGLPAMETDVLLQQSAKNHVDYQNVNGLYNGDPHGEDPNASGFTGSTPSDRCQYTGHDAPCGEVQSHGDGDLYSALDGLIMTPFHRMGLIDPRATEIGCAHTGSWVTCDIGYATTSESSNFDYSEPIIYPANGQVIGTTFPVFESPMPYPSYAGQNIGPTLMFWLPNISAPEAEVSVYDLTAQKTIDAIVSIDTSNFYSFNAVLFNPTEPLKVDHEYAVHVQDVSGNNAYEKVWTFKTQKSSNNDFPNANQTITYDAHVDWANPTGGEQLVSVPNEEIRALVDRLEGYIMLATDYHGEAWYIDPLSRQRYYLKDGPTAYEFLRSFGLGITNADLAKIPTENSTTGGGALATQLSGRILLQVQEHGEAWYINPSDLKRYYMKDGAEAYRIMRELSLGTLMSWISGIPVGNIN